MTPGRALALSTSYLASGLRLVSAIRIDDLGPRPERPLELYDFEACPYCRRVREALTALDLEAIIYPCPRGGSRFRPLVESRGGRTMFPYLVDPNTGVEMYESADIVAYLYERYGDGGPPLASRGPLFLATSMLASMARAGRGVRARPGRLPDQLLELYNMEGSPYCRLVREELCELEIPYRVRNVAKGSPSRKEMVARAGRVQVPYLVDPNTGAEMFESADIVSYLRDTYV